MGRALMGVGKAEYKGRVMSGREAMEKAGIEPVRQSLRKE